MRTLLLTRCGDMLESSCAVKSLLHITSFTTYLFASSLLLPLLPLLTHCYVSWRVTATYCSLHRACERAGYVRALETKPGPTHRNSSIALHRETLRLY